MVGGACGHDRVRGSPLLRHRRCGWFRLAASRCASMVLQSNSFEGSHLRSSLSPSAVIRPDPKSFPMDAPLGALDAASREHRAKELCALHDRRGATAVLVPHDQLEAMQMSGHHAFHVGAARHQACCCCQALLRPRAGWRRVHRRNERHRQLHGGGRRETRGLMPSRSHTLRLFPKDHMTGAGRDCLLSCGGNRKAVTFLGPFDGVPE